MPLKKEKIKLLCKLYKLIKRRHKHCRINMLLKKMREKLKDNLANSKKPRIKLSDLRSKLKLKNEQHSMINS